MVMGCATLASFGEKSGRSGLWAGNCERGPQCGPDAGRKNADVRGYSRRNTGQALKTTCGENSACGCHWWRMCEPGLGGTSVTRNWASGPKSGRGAGTRPG